MNLPADLWAVTAYFNPARFHRRRSNYRVFRRHLRVPLLTVELAFGPDFELGPEDADVLVQLRSQDVMWQKERLLNIALAALPDSCDAVVWMDGDIVFERDDWPMGVRRALDNFALVQPFSRAGHVVADAVLNGDVRKERIDGWEPSIACAVASGRPPLEALRLTPEAQALRDVTPAWPRPADYAHMGFAWGARRELVRRVGLYDGCIVGGGDTCLAAAAFGCFHELAQCRGMTAAEARWYRAWAEAFHRLVAGRVTHLDGAVFHLWHGDLRDRHYSERHQALRGFAFDPFHDIALAENQTWRWNSAKPLLHQYVRDYFAARKEDGV